MTSLVRAKELTELLGNHMEMESNNVFKQLLNSKKAPITSTTFSHSGIVFEQFSYQVSKSRFILIVFDQRTTDFLDLRNVDRTRSVLTNFLLLDLRSLLGKRYVLTTPRFAITSI
jgi:hypothetical protein